MRVLFVFFMAFPFLTFCQVEEKPDTFIDYLVQENFISKKESSKIAKDAFLLSLYDLYLDRYGLERGQRRGMYNIVLISGAELRTEKLIEALYSYKKISKYTYQDLKQKLKNKEKKHALTSEQITSDMEVFQYLWELEQTQTAVKNGELKSYLKELKDIGVLKSTEFDWESLKTQKDIFPLVESALIINTDSLPESLEDSYRYAFDQLTKIDTTLSVSNLSFSIQNIQDKYLDYLKYQSAVITFSCSEIDYVSRDSYDKLDENFYRIFNKVLTDKGSPYRIMNIERTDDNLIALIPITKEQYHFLKEEDRKNNSTYFSPNWYRLEVSEHWNPFDLLSKDETLKYFNIYDSIGIFDHFSSAEKKAQLEMFQKTYLHSSEGLLYRMKNGCLSFDWEMFDGKEPYKSAILDFASISRGEFTPTKIKDNFSFDKKTADISFDFNGKTYQTTVEVTGDWYDGKFLTLIEKAIQENKLSGQYYDLPDGGQMSLHIYLTAAQHKYLEDHKYLEFYKGP